MAGIDAGDPGRVTALLQELGAASARNIGADAAAASAAALAVPGMTPNPAARRLLLRGQRPGGEAIPVMPFPSLSQMNDVDLRGVYAFLQTLPAREPGNR